LLELAAACRDYSRQEGTPVTTALALTALFLGMGKFIDDRPVTTAETDKLVRRLSPLLDLLAQGRISESEAITEQFSGLRDLIR
jgi:hypothetical protein